MIGPLDRRFGALAVAGLAVIAAIVGVGLHSAAQLREDVTDLDRARDAQSHVQRITTTLLELETSQRGYLLTLDPAHLLPFDAGLASLEQELDGVAEAITDEAEASAELRRLRSLIDARRELLARTVGLARAHGGRAGMDTAEEGRGKAVTDDIRASLARLDHQIASTQAQRRADRSVSIERNERLVYLLAAALVLLMTTLFALVRRDRTLHERMRAVEAAARERLEEQVAARTSELQSATQELALSADRLRGIFDAAGEGILTTDEAQVIVEANAAAAQIFRCTVADLIGTPLERLIPPRYRDGHRHSVEAFGTGAVRSRFMRAADGSREVVALRFDGEEFPIEASISRTEVDGQRLYTVIHRDLTERRRAEAALHSSRQLIAATFDASSVAMTQIDPLTRRFVAVNDAMCRLSGYDAAELLAMDPDGLNHPEDRLDSAKLGALLRGDAPYREEKRLVRRDGRIVCVEVTGSVVRGADGQAVRVVGFLQDITVRREAEQALRANAARQAFLVRLNDRLRELDDAQQVVHEASTLLAGFLGAQRVGYGEEDAGGEFVTAGANHAQGVPPLDGRHRLGGPSLLRALRSGHTLVRDDIAGDPALTADEKQAFAALQVGAAVAVPLAQDLGRQAVFFVHADAARTWRTDEVSLIEDVARRIRADVTRVKAESAVRGARAMLDAALDSMNDAVLITDVDGRFVQFNDAFVAFHRFRGRDECGTSLADYPALFDVFVADGTPAPLEQWAVARALRGEAGSSVEYRLRRKDTGETWVGSHSFAPIRADDGRIVGSVVNSRDVTRLKRTQEELATSHAALRHLIANEQRVQEEERKRIARELHDDLQQSLAAIRMDAVAIGERLARGRRDVEPLLARIDRLSGAAITSARRIVSDLRPEMLEELGLRPALEALCAEHARRTGASCRFEVCDGEGEVPVDGPLLSIALFRIAQEALNNVAKHAQARHVSVRLDASHGGLVVLRIADDGVGFGPRERREPESFGLLGMAERVRALGGQLRIEANGDRGTVVEALVPVLDPELDPARPDGPAVTPDGRPRAAQGLGIWDMWGRPLQTLIDALDGNVAVLDTGGVIQLVNRAWREFAAGHGRADLAGCGPGVDYLAVCQRSADAEPAAATALQGLRGVLEGRDDTFEVAYPCDLPGGRRWFRLHAASITGGLALVSHVLLHAAGAPGAANGGLAEPHMR